MYQKASEPPSYVPYTLVVTLHQAKLPAVVCAIPLTRSDARWSDACSCKSPTASLDASLDVILLARPKEAVVLPHSEWTSSNTVTESAAARCGPTPPISVPRAPAPGAISVHALTRSGYYPNNCLDPQTRDNEQSGAVWPPNARVICPLSVHSGAPPLWSRGELRQTGCHGPNHTQSVSPIVFYVGRHSRGVSTECLVVRTKRLTRVSDRRSKR